MFGLSGLHVAALAAAAYLGAGGGARGILPVVAVVVWMAASPELATRVWVLPEERENWALPFLSLRALATMQLLQRRESSDLSSSRTTTIPRVADTAGHVAGATELTTDQVYFPVKHWLKTRFAFTARPQAPHRTYLTDSPGQLLGVWLWTTLFCLMWQFAPFVMALQALAALLTFLAHGISAATLRTMITVAICNKLTNFVLKLMNFALN